MSKGALFIEGKTKAAYDYSDSDLPPGEYVCFENKDKITAFDGLRVDDLVGKATLSNATNGKVFHFLNAAGFPTAFVKPLSDTSFIARKCQMIPLEWVTRRIATGSFLKRNPGVREGFRFIPVKLETFYKDDANHDPQWSEEQVIDAGLEFGGVVLGRLEYDYMSKMTVTAFEILERAWAPLDCTLVDMKIEFGVDFTTKNIILADVIDSDSWRLWPSGDKRLMKDKQVYRNLKEVTSDSLLQVKTNFQWVADQLDKFMPTTEALAVIVMGSPSDKSHCEKIAEHCESLGIPSVLRVCSAHKSTADVLRLIAEYESLSRPVSVIYIAVAGRSNGLGPVLSANATFPVINCPPFKASETKDDIWSSLNTPSGLGCATVLYREAAAQHAATILSLTDSLMFAKLKVKQLKHWRTLRESDKECRQISFKK